MKKTLLIVIQVIIIAMAGGMITASNPTVLPTTPTSPSSSQKSIPTKSAPMQVYTPIPYSKSIIRLAWFYKPPDETQVDLVVKKSDFFILTHKDETERSQLKAKGVTVPFSQYLLFSVINDPGDCEKQPNGNQVAYKPGDFCQISQLHPDWFLLDENGNRISSSKSSYYMDPGSAGFRAFWLERARELQETYGWDNIFLDNVEASRSKMVDNGGSLAKYPDDKSYQQAVEGFLAYIRQNYFQPKHKPIYANIVSGNDDAVWESYLQYVDGAMIESFATDWSNGYASRDEWEQEMNQAEQALAQGKVLILVAQGKQKDAKLQNFALASYLLIANGNAFFRYTNSDSYRDLWIYENYNLDLGLPLGNRYKYKGGWRRDFANGYVTVTPQKNRAEIILNP